MNDRAAKLAAADRLLAAECELRAAQDALRADDSNENRARYRRAVE